MIYRRYGAAGHEILEMPVPLFVELYGYARDKEFEDKLYQRWMFGGHCHEQSFDDFKAELMAAANPKKPDEIYAEVENILNAFQKKGGA